MKPIPKKIFHIGTIEIVCPFCGYETNDSSQHQEDKGEEECDNCWERYSWERDIMVDYTTVKIT